jgi:hypothetical protein
MKQIIICSWPNYYEHISTEKANERWYIANIYVHKNAVVNVFFDEESISLGLD